MLQETLIARKQEELCRSRTRVVALAQVNSILERTLEAAGLWEAVPPTAARAAGQAHHHHQPPVMPTFVLDACGQVREMVVPSADTDEKPPARSSQ